MKLLKALTLTALISMSTFWAMDNPDVLNQPTLEQPKMMVASLSPELIAALQANPRINGLRVLSQTDFLTLDSKQRLFPILEKLLKDPAQAKNDLYLWELNFISTEKQDGFLELIALSTSSQSEQSDAAYIGQKVKKLKSQAVEYGIGNFFKFKVTEEICKLLSNYGVSDDQQPPAVSASAGSDLQD